ncbi:hypothetical protein [Roseibium sp. RKSG952]|nr:hypothetical protein [Roseibium sp. RKSG952]
MEFALSGLGYLTLVVLLAGLSLGTVHWIRRKSSRAPDKQDMS